MGFLAILAGLAPFALALTISIPLWIWVWRMLSPRHVYGPPSRSVVWLGRLRTLGLLGSAAVYLVYLGFDTERAAEAALGPIQDGMRSLPAVLIGMLVVVVAARSGRRGAAVRALGRPLAAVLLLAGFAAAVLVAVNTIDAPPVNETPPGEKFDETTGATVTWMLAAGSWIAGGIAFGALTILVCYLAVRHWCVAADANPMLPAIITITYAAMSAGWYLYDGETPGVPPLIDRAIALGGPAALVVVCAIELAVLRRQGATLAGPPARVWPYGGPRPYWVTIQPPSTGSRTPLM